MIFQRIQLQFLKILSSVFSFLQANLFQINLKWKGFLTLLTCKHLTSFWVKMLVSPYVVLRFILTLHFNLPALHLSSCLSFTSRENGAFFLTIYLVKARTQSFSKYVFLFLIRNLISQASASPNRIMSCPSERRCWKEAKSCSLMKKREIYTLI